MESFKGSHKYRRLRGSDIRVVRFKPCASSDSGHETQIEGQISHVPLLNSDFFALSYVWGDASVTKAINLDGQDFPITINLWKAILSLRNRYDPDRKLHDKSIPEICGETGRIGDNWREHAIYWWIDAICIDQADIEERSRQVPRMKDLYSKATRVIVWWGDEWGDPAFGETQQDVNLLFRAGEKLHESTALSDPDLHFNQVSHKTRIDLLNETFENPEDLTRPLVFIARTGWDWMSRVWTLQEAVLSRQDPALIMGEEVTGLWTYMKLQECVAAASWTGGFQSHVIAGDQEALINRVLYDMYILSLRVSRRLAKPETPVLNARARISEVLSYHVTSLRTKSPSRRSRSYELSETLTRFGDELLECLGLFSERRATTPHDRIYGLLGLVDIPYLPSDLQPDYNRSFSDVCFAYAKFLIKTSGNLYILSLGTSRFEGFPTWVPDFTESLHGETGATSVSVVFSEDERCISVPGANLGEIVGIYYGHDKAYSNACDDPKEVLNMFCDLGRVIMVPASEIRRCDARTVVEEWAASSTACSVFGANVSDILTITEYFSKEAPSEWYPEALACVRALRTYFQITTNVLLDSGTMCNWSNNYAIIRIRKSPKIGDFVYALKGTTRPTLLRPRSQGDGFEVTGICYLAVLEEQHFKEEFFERKRLETVHLY